MNKDLKKFKPLVKDFVQYYYFNLGANNESLNILLHGFFDDLFLETCLADCERMNDTFGIFLTNLLMEFSEEELKELKGQHFWDMKILPPQN